MVLYASARHALVTVKLSAFVLARVSRSLPHAFFRVLTRSFCVVMVAWDGLSLVETHVHVGMPLAVVLYISTVLLAKELVARNTRTDRRAVPSATATVGSKHTCKQCMNEDRPEVTAQG